VQRIGVSLLLVASCLTGQAVDSQAAFQNLSASLRELRASHETLVSHRDRINKDILALSDAAHRPSMFRVATFTARLTDVLVERNVSASQAATIATEINTVLQGAGLGTWKIKDALSGLTAALNAIGVSATDAKKVATELEMLGNEVRGPQGMPLRRLE
jgi:hypothetical protein